MQQQIAGPLQSNAQLLAAQQAEIKRLSDQVAGLAAKVNALEHPPATAQAALPVSAPPPPSPGTGGGAQKIRRAQKARKQSRSAARRCRPTEPAR